MSNNMVMTMKTRTALVGLFEKMHLATTRCQAVFQTTRAVLSDVINDDEMRAQVYREALHPINGEPIETPQPAEA